MTSDEREPGAFETLIGKLRESIGQQVQTVLDDFHSSAAAHHEQAIAEAKAEAERQAADRLAAEVSAAEAKARDAAHADGYALGKDHGFAAGKDEGFTAGKDIGYHEGKDEGFAAGKDEGLTAGRAEGFATGKDHGYAEGKEHGFAAGAEEARAQAPPPVEVLVVDTAAADRLSEAVRAIGRARSLSEVLDALVEATSREANRAALLLVRGDRFRSWRLVGFESGAAGAAPIEFPGSEAGILADVATSNTVLTGDAGVPPLFAALEAGHPFIGFPIALGGEVVAVLYADRESAPIKTASLDIIVRHATRSLEAVTAFKAARAIMAQPDAPAAKASASSTSGNETPADADASAQRYARLLVSEIKLYHEAAVAAGRREGDLGRRLSGEITRARELYEQRVPQRVRARADYFHDELVRTLANGDAGLLEARS